LVNFLPVEISEELESDSSIPPTMQSINAIIVGSCAIWMMRLRRELAVARLVMMFPIALRGRN
jgi:hypothetical protein